LSGSGDGVSESKPRVKREREERKGRGNQNGLTGAYLTMSQSGRVIEMVMVRVRVLVYSSIQVIPCRVSTTT
jgi:hypothetical protein